MKYAIIYAHPNPKSFNHAIKVEVEANLKKAGRESVVRDLYALKFNPVLDAGDFIALSKGAPLPDVQAEQKIIREAETFIIIHPVWWFGMPAILKGYIDRVFSRGFAYDYNATGVMGLLKDKKVVIINTTGGTEETYLNFGFKDAVQKNIDTGTFGLCGMSVTLHKFFYGVPAVTDDVRKKMLEEIKNTIL